MVLNGNLWIGVVAVIEDENGDPHLSVKGYKWHPSRKQMAEMHLRCLPQKKLVAVSPDALVFAARFD